jgi:hypothetical protein
LIEKEVDEVDEEKNGSEVEGIIYLGAKVTCCQGLLRQTLNLGHNGEDCLACKVETQSRIE